MGLLYEELSYLVRGCIYEVHNELGVGLDEESYQMALERKLAAKNIAFRSQEVRYIVHRGERVHKFKLDLIIEDKIILELKVLETGFHPENIFQLLSYLKCWKKQLGMLVNFGLPKVAIKRIPFTEKKYKMYEDYDYIKAHITPNIRPLLIEFRNALITIMETHGLGYGETVYRKLLIKELAFKKIDFTSQAIVPVFLDDQLLKNYEIKWPIINNQFICGIAVLKESLNLDIAKMQNYLNALKLPFGLLAHFGKERLEIYGIKPSKEVLVT